MKLLIFLFKARIKEIQAKDKLQYLYCLLSAVLPIVKRIHAEQCSEVELEKRFRGMMLLCFNSMFFKFPLFVCRVMEYMLSTYCCVFSGNEIDLARTKLNADEQMCW